jgi:hypothetical protein
MARVVLNFRRHFNPLLPAEKANVSGKWHVPSPLKASLSQKSVACFCHKIHDDRRMTNGEVTAEIVVSCQHDRCVGSEV